MRWLCFGAVAVAVAVGATVLVTSPATAQLFASVESFPTPTLAPLSPSGPTAATGVIVNRWGQLFLDGQPYHFLSLDASNAATLWSVNWGCGWQASDVDLDALFGSLPPHTLVPFWATQAMAYNDRGRPGIDFTAIDRVFEAATRHGQFLMPELEDAGRVLQRRSLEGCQLVRGWLPIVIRR